MFLFGLGVGLVLASMLLTLTLPGKEISQEEVERKARELGMVYREEILVFNEEPELAKENFSEEEEQISASEPEPLQEVKVIIPAGSDSGKIALILKNSGVILDEKEFLSVVYGKNLASKLKAGEFLFPPGANIDQVIELITN